MTSGDAHWSIEHVSQALDDAHVFRLAYHRPHPAVRFADGEFLHSVSDVFGTRRLRCGAKYEESLTSGAKYEESLTSGDAPESIELVP